MSERSRRELLFDPFKIIKKIADPKNFSKENLKRAALAGKKESPETKKTEDKDVNLARREFLKLGRTALETTLVNVAAGVAAKIGESLRLPLGDAHVANQEALIKFIKEHPGKFLGMASVLAPINEELMFRLLPLKLAKKITKNPGWETAIPSALLFAVVHNVNMDNMYEMEISLDPRKTIETLRHLPEQNIRFEKRIPLAHFAMGLYLWYVMRERGIGHAMLAHSIVNTEAFGVAQLLYKNFPGK